MKVKWEGTYGDVRVSGISFGVSGGENCVDKDEGAYDLSTQASARAVASRQGVGSTPIPVVEGLLESLHQATPTYGSQALSHYVRYRSNQRHLPSQK